MINIFYIFLDNPAAEVKLFGSSLTGLALPDSDIDYVICGFEQAPKLEKNSLL